MTPIRPKRSRAAQFETLEGRLALNASAEMLAPQHAHAIVSRAPARIPASFKGHVEILNGSQLQTTSLQGKIGTDIFTGSATGTVVGKKFKGGDVLLSNANGTVELQLNKAVQVRTGPASSKQEVSLVVVAATGKYASYAGIDGLLTTWNVPPKPVGTAKFSGYFKP